MKIAVLAGGLSPEREVSLTSGSLIANALAAEGHKVVLVDVYLGKELPEGESVASLFSSDVTYSHTVSEVEPDLDALMRESGNGSALVGKNVIEICRAADVAFLALHGASGENGQIQATLDSYGILYTGSGYIGSLLAMDKDLSKTVLLSAGILTPKGITVNTDHIDVPLIEHTVGYPAVVKPCSCGSSVGISMANNREELTNALLLAAKYESRILVEQRIIGREFTMAVIGGTPYPPVEIIPKSGFYDYKNKYQAGRTEEICPAEISAEDLERMGRASLAAFAALRLRDYARFDFIRDENGEFWCLEANTLPGMTPTSLLPQEAAAAGIDYRTLCDKLARMALEH
ncbi:MAG: D-alanine--D-alanine ligase [Clostridia bacterium]|nr:D-alanine--D-alanine ligase [Clostridia bacterium]